MSVKYKVPRKVIQSWLHHRSDIQGFRGYLYRFYVTQRDNGAVILVTTTSIPANMLIILLYPFMALYSLVMEGVKGMWEFISDSYRYPYYVRKDGLRKNQKEMLFELLGLELVDGELVRKSK